LATPVLEQLSSESNACAGFPADTYDRYVLGLLDSAERASVEKELQQQCPACIAGVQRSVNLWLVFAGSLAQVEPSADFRARLIRIAELSNRILTVPKHYRRKPVILFSSLVVIGIVLGVLLVFTFLAGKQSSNLDFQSLKSQLANVHSEADESQRQLEEESERNKAFQAQLNQHPNSSGSLKQVQDELVKALAQIQRDQAELRTLNDSVERDKQRANENSTLVTALQNPGARMLTFKVADGSAAAAYATVSAYAFVIENSRILFVASKMPPLPDQHVYQLWMIRKSDHHFVSLGVFSSKADVPAVVTYEDSNRETIPDLASLTVTDEAASTGSADPSDTRVIETPGAAAVPTPTPVATPPAAMTP
jgi:anti-sigma-K factor RskA